MSPPGLDGPPTQPGTTIDGWRIDALLGDGATTLTYRVTSVAGGQAGVLRLLKIKDPTFAERLRRNANALAGTHEHLVPVLGVVEEGGFTGVVTAWIDGPDLGTWAQGDAPLAHRLALFRDVIAGLDQAHRANLVHRNLKPVKIRVRSIPGEPVEAFLEDFLLSRVELQSDSSVTALGVTFGTPQYMSPEQFHGAADVTARGDLFSAGCVLYELVTGQRAFDGGSIRDVYMAIIDGAYTDPKEVAPELPEPVLTLVRDLLEPATEDRPASAAAVLERMDDEAFAHLIARPVAPAAGPEDAPVRKATPAPAEPRAVGEVGDANLRGEAPPARPATPAAFPTLLAPDELDDADSEDAPGAPPPVDGDSALEAPTGLSANTKTLWLVAGIAFGGGALFAFLVVLVLATFLASG